MADVRINQAAESATGTASTVSVTTSNTSVLAADTLRLGATVYNEGTSVVYLALSATATTTAYAVKIAVDGYYELPYKWVGAVAAITATGTATLRVTEVK